MGGIPYGFERSGGGIRRKRSRFIGCIRPAASEEEALAFSRGSKRRIGTPAIMSRRMSCAKGRSAAIPTTGNRRGRRGCRSSMLLLKAGLADCAVMVIRYFGGTLLGTGGLVRAYSHSASLAVGAAKPVEMRPCVRLILRCDYARVGMAEPLILSCGGILDGTAYAEDVTLRFHMPFDRLPDFERQLTEKAPDALRRCGKTRHFTRLICLNIEKKNCGKSGKYTEWKKKMACPAGKTDAVCV